MADVLDNASPVEGAAAHDAAVVGNPVAVGLRANANEPAAVSADGDAAWAWGDRLGRLVTVDSHPSPDAPDTATLTLTSDAAIKAAPGASLSIYVLLLTLTNTSGTAVRVDIKDGTTTRFSMFLAASGGGAVIPIPGPGWKLAANTALNGALGTAVTDVRVSAVCYIAA